MWALPVQVLQEASFPRAASCPCTLVLQRAMGVGDTCRYVVLPLGRPARAPCPSLIICKSCAPTVLTSKEVLTCWFQAEPYQAACWGSCEHDGQYVVSLTRIQ